LSSKPDVLKKKSSVTKPALPQSQKSPYLLRSKKEKKEEEEEEKRVTRQKKASSTHTDSGVSNTSPVRSQEMFDDSDYSYDSSDSSDSDDSSTAKVYMYQTAVQDILNQERLNGRTKVRPQQTALYPMCHHVHQVELSNGRYRDLLFS